MRFLFDSSRFQAVRLSIARSAWAAYINTEGPKASDLSDLPRAVLLMCLFPQSAALVQLRGKELHAVNRKQCVRSIQLTALVQ